MKLSTHVLSLLLLAVSCASFAAVENDLPRPPGIDTKGFENEVGKWVRPAGAVYEANGLSVK